MQTNLAQLKESKDTYQKSAEYLRGELRKVEKDLEEIKEELAKEKKKREETEQAQTMLEESHQEELKKRGESYKVVQERNRS